jgi:hypothetical protein
MLLRDKKNITYNSMSSISNIMPSFSSPSVADRWFRVLLLRRFIVFSIIMTALRAYLTGILLNINTKNPEGMPFL